MIGDKVIGQMLSGSPVGPDGVWPHPVVRDLVEDVSNSEVERGIEFGRYFGRGVVSKNPLEGGVQERQVADRHERDAGAVSDRWPRTAAMLRRLAAAYRADAEREDQEAELREDLGR